MYTHDPQFLLDNPVEIGSALKELQRGGELLAAQVAGERVQVYVTSVNVRQRTVSFTPYGGARERALMRNASKLEFHGRAYGTPMEFSLGPFEETEEENDEGDTRVVLRAQFPTQLYRIQRRQFFRAAVAPPNTRRATWTTPEGRTLRFRIQDVSLSGIGLRCEANVPGLPKDGQLMHPVQLDFEEHGSVEAWLQVVARRVTTEFDTRRGHLEYVHLGCVFAEPDNQREAFLQRLVFLLEQNQRKA